MKIAMYGLMAVISVYLTWRWINDISESNHFGVFFSGVIVLILIIISNISVWVLFSIIIKYFK